MKLLNSVILRLFHSLLRQIIPNQDHYQSLHFFFSFLSPSCFRNDSKLDRCCEILNEIIFLFYLGFLSRTFTIHRAAVEGGGYFFQSSLPLPPASQTLRHQSGDCCRELTSAHSQQPDSNREPLVSERKSLITKLRSLKV